MIYNDPDEFTEDAVEGFVDLYQGYLRQVPGGVIRRNKPARPKVAIVVGGGSGHYPAFAGVVGPGFADGAVIGNVFTSPSAAYAYSVGRRSNSGGGVILTYGNYAGDVMNFGIAADRLRADGIDAREVIVTDDIASADRNEREKRRGIAGDFVVFKMMSAAADRYMDIDEVYELGQRANESTFTVGVAFSGCTLPGADAPLFTVPKNKIGLGLGIHGEPGLRDIDWMSAKELAALMTEMILEERPAESGNRVAVLLNGLGATKYEELFLLWGHVATLLRDEGLELVSPEVGELVTSLDMGGVSLTVCWLDETLEELWLDPADTPSWKRGNLMDTASVDPGIDSESELEIEDAVVAGSPESQGAAAQGLVALKGMQEVIHSQAKYLGDLDAIAGDGDHGRGMTKGVDAAVSAADAAVERGAGIADTFAKAGDAWAEHAGGTSGVLWGAALHSFGTVLRNDSPVTTTALIAAVEAFAKTIRELGKAEIGDKTIVDAIEPFVEEFKDGLTGNATLIDAWANAAKTASAAAQSTENLTPKKGRARPLAERSIGHPDPGAVSFALCVEAVGQHVDFTTCAQK